MQTKSDLALQMHSTKEKKYKRIWNGNKDRGRYKNLTSRGNQQEGILSNQKQSSNQCNHVGGAAGRGRGGGRKPDKSPINVTTFKSMDIMQVNVEEKRKKIKKVMQNSKHKE